MSDKEKKTKKEKKLKAPTEGQTSVQTSAEEVAPIEKKKKKKDEAEPTVNAKAPKVGKPKKGDSVDGTHQNRVPGNTKTPEEVKPEVKQVTAPSREEIAQLAHRFWKERGGHHGSHDSDWYRAEQELHRKAS